MYYWNLSPNLNTSAYNIKGFFLIRNDRKLLNQNNAFIRGGGFATYIHDSYNYKILKQSKSKNINSIEYLIVEIFHRSTNTIKFLLCPIYRHPNGDLLDSFFEIIDQFSSSYNIILITGDLNSNLMKNKIDASNLRRL